MHELQETSLHDEARKATCSNSCGKCSFLGKSDLIKIYIFAYFVMVAYVDLPP